MADLHLRIRKVDNRITVITADGHDWVLRVADAYRTCIVPKLHAAGWDNDFIIGQRAVDCLDSLQAVDTVELGRNS